MPFVDALVHLGGGFDVAINSNSRYDMAISVSKSNCCGIKAKLYRNKALVRSLRSNGRTYRANAQSDVKGLLTAAHCEAEGHAASAAADD
jgi:hypothetical protein